MLLGWCEMKTYSMLSLFLRVAHFFFSFGTIDCSCCTVMELGPARIAWMTRRVSMLDITIIDDVVATTIVRAHLVVPSSILGWLVLLLLYDPPPRF